MSDRFLEILRDSRLSMNYIPSGRQLPRTPPLMSVKKELDFCNDDSNVDCEEPEQNIEADSRDQGDNNPNTTFDFNTIRTKKEPDEPNSMLKGMKGYQLTPTDLEFIEKMKAEKHIKRLQLPSCEDLTEWVKVVLEMTSPSTELTGLDAESLLALVTEENIQRATEEKRFKLARMKSMEANKREKEAKERGQLEKLIAGEQLKIHGLMSQLSDLKSEVAQQQETYKALEMQISTQEAPEIPAEEVDTSEELQAAKTQAKGRGKGRTKTVKFSLKTKQKSGAAVEKPMKSVKEARGPQKKVEEQESNSQESVQAVRGRRKPPGPAQPENQSHVKAGKAPSTSQQAAPSQGKKGAATTAGDAGEEAQSTVLRRSKRIASRR
ncbi:uncharacterized protein si:dkeyp-34c12.1 isoform X2 [Sebastes umbrosus]|uniref:uncharacterized protein si:dkeyp-34c12.1 isoform X2 n=1 Tax=Sebastes umbrosus TaxID=72105 RepID=UPI0018A10FCF|nr:uncharacterized protein si:dkeyp-34c12.1 isoform X2 [Sebastes umbrosus]